MNFTQQLLAELFTKAVNFKTVTVKNVSQGSTINVSLGYGSVRAQALQDISGDCIVFQTDQGNWYLIGNSAANQNSSNRTQIVYRKTGQKIELVYTVITLIQSDLYSSFRPNPKPEGHKDVEYWLTGGGKYSLKRIVTEPTLGFDQSEAEIYEDGGDAFLQNAGNGKYLVATRSYELPPINYGGASNRTYQRNIFTIQKEDKSTVKIISDFYGNFVYLGNGIYQSFIEDGIGRIFAAMPSFLRTNYSRVVNASINIGNRDANILPETSNYTIYNGQLIENTGSLNIDLTNIYSYYDLGGTNIWLSDRTFAWRDKTIQHSVWLPTGNSTFNYTATKTKFRNNVPSIESESFLERLYNYTYNETMSGEVLVMSWKDKYITNTFNIAKESKDWNTYIPNTGYSDIVNTRTEEITSKTEIFTLKTYGDAEGKNNLALNTNGKWLILPKQPRQINSDTNLVITKETTSFRIKVNIGYIGSLPEDYNSEDYKPDYDLTPYINESIITSFMIDNNAYIVRGKITAINFELYSPNNTNIYYGRFWFTIRITEFKSIPKVKAKESFGYSEWQLPFPWRIVLDNGCFWNYYLSYTNSNVEMVEASLTSYPLFKYGNIYSVLTSSSYRFNLSLLPFVLCNQSVKYIPTNPITIPFTCITFPSPTTYLVPHQMSLYYPPSNLLISDNLVGNSIYRVNDDFLMQTYIEWMTSDMLSITKMPVSEWKISSNGDIRYNKTFLVDYQLKRPYYNKETDKSDALSITLVTQSYHP